MELDSDTSSVAAWSFSMATPTTARQDVEKEAPSSVDISVVSTTTSPCVSEGEEGISSGDESVLRLLGKRKSEHSMTLLKIKDKMLMKHKVCI